MSKEVMRQALEALEAERDNYQDWDEKDGAPEYIHEAITALREALAEQPAQQDPYGYLSTHTNGLMHFNQTLQGVYRDTATEIVAVYTSPPAQHTWVGLTDDERANCWSSSAKQSAINIEAKLKEKNT